MNYCSLAICFIVSVLGNETKQFVEFKKAEVVKVTEDKYTSITLPFEVLEGYHIQSNSDISGGLIATGITFEENGNYKIEDQEFSLKRNEVIVLKGVEQAVISNRFEITLTLKFEENNSNVKLAGELYYQACTDRQCFFPRTLNFQLVL